MTVTQHHEPVPSLRLWPGVAIALLLVVARFIAPLVHPDAILIGVLGGVVSLAAVLAWWLLFSRARWLDRIGAPIMMAVAVAATYPLLHESLSTGMNGMLFFIFAVPVTLTLAFVGWAVVAGRLPDGPRRMTMAVAILVGCALWLLLRTDGILGGLPELAWRWTPTAEERLLAQGPGQLAPPVAQAEGFDAPDRQEGDAAALAKGPRGVEPATGTAPDPPDVSTARSSPRIHEPARITPRAWTGFRGPARDGVVPGLAIATDWARTPPAELWRRPIGPGWSSFAVQGGLIYTQEQRGDQEMVAAYKLTTGEPVWSHGDAARFWESNGGPGPRSTPALGHGRVYTMGATGIVNALEAGTGARVWTRNAATDTGAEVPGWGFAASPLVVGDLVIVAASGRLVAYDARTGALRWLGPAGGAGYSSPHVVTIEGTAQVLLLRSSRTVAVSPEDGAVLWEHTWTPGVGIVQPAQTTDGDILLTVGDAMGGLGVRRISVTRSGSDGWSVTERWTSRGLKPYFNDFAIHEGHAYGFDGSILSCIDLADGMRKWKGGRYGQGQFVLLPASGVLLVVSEEGELALVKAAPDKHTELARIPGIEGKTWNHPVVIGDVLLVRNGEEMAAFRLPRVGG